MLVLVLRLRLGLCFAGTLLRSWDGSLVVILVFDVFLDLLALGSGLLPRLLLSLLILVLFAVLLRLLRLGRPGFLIPEAVGFGVLGWSALAFENVYRHPSSMSCVTERWE